MALNFHLSHFLVTIKLVSNRTLTLHYQKLISSHLCTPSIVFLASIHLYHIIPPKGSTSFNHLLRILGEHSENNISLGALSNCEEYIMQERVALPAQTTTIDNLNQGIMVTREHHMGIPVSNYYLSLRDVEMIHTTIESTNKDLYYTCRMALEDLLDIYCKASASSDGKEPNYCKIVATLEDLWLVKKCYFQNSPTYYAITVPIEGE